MSCSDFAVRYASNKEITRRMSECKHGLRSGCSYCHAPGSTTRRPPAPAAPRKRGSSSSLSEKMNDRMTALKKRLKELRGE
jgi:hypothetical protein